VPWAARAWALPFLAALAPSERADQTAKRRHKKVTDWARQLLLQVRRWLPDRALVVVGDSAYAVLGLLGRCAGLANPITVVTRLRLDARLFAPAPPRRAGQRGRPAVVGQRLPGLAQRTTAATTVWTACTVAHWDHRGERTVEVASDTAVWYHGGLPPVPIRWVLIRDPRRRFATQALLCTALDVPPDQILTWFLLRWQMEVTFAEVRRHLGVETQRQWADLAIARTTPALLGLFSLVTLLVQERCHDTPLLVRQAAWYRKEHATFSDALALVRADLWTYLSSCMSAAHPDCVQIPRELAVRLTETLCYAA
jgi:hypothetical protein